MGGVGENQIGSCRDDAAEEVSAVQSEIESIQADRKTELVAEPPQLD